MQKNSLSLEHIQSLLEPSDPKPDEALLLLTPAAGVENPAWQVLHYIGVAYIHKKDLDTALVWLQKAIKAGSEEALTNHLISVCYCNKGELEKAKQFEYDALGIKPFFEGWMHLGGIYKAGGDLKKAIECYKEAAKIEPENTDITHQIAEIYGNNGRLDKAIELLETTIVEDDNQNTKTYFALALLLKKKRQHEEAKKYLSKILDVKPDNIPSKALLSDIKREEGHYDEALVICEEVLKEHPDNQIRLNYALLYQELGEFEKAETNYRRLLEDHPGLYQALSNYLMCIHYNPAQTKDDIFRAHKLWDQYFLPDEPPTRPEPKNKQETKPLRVGFISGGFQIHPVGWMITEALEYLPEDLSIYCYSTENKHDFITHRISGAADKWRSVVGYSDKVIAEMIREDEIDILIELSGHGGGNRLRTIAEEPAPVIAKWVGGLFNTTGLKAIDYLITDQYETPEGEEPYYTEKLVRMPDDYISYHAPSYALRVQPPPAKENGYMTFGCFNNPAKVNDKILHQWAKILNRLPGSQLLLKSKQYDTKALRDRIIQKLSEEGIAEDRVTFKGQSKHKDHLNYYNNIDIALDPWPYSGGLTTCEALWMGVPVITKPGPTFAGKHSKTHLINAGFGDWVVDSWDEYVEKTLDLAGDIEQLAELRSTIREQVTNSPLCDGPRFAAHFAKALRAMWKQRAKGYEENNEKWQHHIRVEPLSEQEAAAIAGASRIEKKASNNNPSNMKQANGIDQHTSNGTTETSGQEDNIIPNQQNSNHELHRNGEQEYSPLNVEQQDIFRIETVDDVIICTPADLDVLSSYVLLEQEQWFEPELGFIREFLRPGMHAVDVGAGFGVYTLPMAKIVEQQGRVYAFEPGSLAKRHLQTSVLENGMENIELSSKAVGDVAGTRKLHQAKIPELNRLTDNNGAATATTTLDDWWQYALKTSVDFIKLDVNGDEDKVLAGAQKLMTEESPVVLVAIGESNTDEKEAIIEKLQAYSYQLYEYVPELGLLTEHDPRDYDAYLMNLVALPEGHIQEFKDTGWIYDADMTVHSPENDAWKEALSSQPWAEALMNNWDQQGKNGAKEYFEALNLLCAAENIEIDGSENRINRSRKANLVLDAVRLLIELYNEDPSSVEISMTLARGLHMIGQRSQAVAVLKTLMDHNDFANRGVELMHPMLLPLPEQDHTRIKTNLKNWLTVRLVEAWILLKSPTTYFSGEQEQQMVEMLDVNPESGSTIKKSNILIGRLHQQETEGSLDLKKRRNNWFWDGYSAYDRENINVVDIKDINDFNYSNPDGVAIIMPCIDLEKGLKTAKILQKRAGLPSQIIIVYDSEGLGFINTFNKTFEQLDVRYVVYLAQDAFPGRHWLRQAYVTLENSGKSLLAFNDGKWFGTIASFGMIRTSWVKNIYGKTGFYPGYNSHCADDELTAIARATNQHAYNPNATLIEIDFKKGMFGGGNYEDRLLFFQRFREGFNGLAPMENLQQLSMDYNVKNMPKAKTAPHENKERRIGDGLKHDILAQIHQELAPNMYLEIGVQTGKSLALAKCKAIGVDPNPLLTVALPPERTEVVPMTSDDFFQRGLYKKMQHQPDLIFIDGMHLIEYAVRDFINVEKNASESSVIVIDDILPAHPAQAQRERITRAWAGDIWKILKILQKYRPELFLLPINASPTGLLLVGGLDPSNTVLEDNLQTIISDYKRVIKPPNSIIEREGVISSKSNLINDFLSIMKTARLEKQPRSHIIRKLKDLESYTSKEHV